MRLTFRISCIPINPWRWDRPSHPAHENPLNVRKLSLSSSMFPMRSTYLSSLMFDVWNKYRTTKWWCWKFFWQEQRERDHNYLYVIPSRTTTVLNFKTLHQDHLHHQDFHCRIFEYLIMFWQLLQSWVALYGMMRLLRKT